MLGLCAQYGLSMRQTATLMDRSVSAVQQMAGRLGVSFHGKMGAPKGNNNRRIGELRKRTLEADRHIITE